MDVQESRSPPPVAVVGAGAVGTVLSRRLVRCGYRVEAVLNRHESAAQALADRIGVPVAASAGAALPSTVRLVMVCVPDEAIPSVAERLAAVDHPWPATVVAHTSGVRTAAALDPLSQKGATTLSFHPLQTFTAETDPETFEGIVVGIEGAPSAVAAGKTLAHAVGADPLPLTAESKTRYHCAAALASNGLVALLGVVEEMLAGISRTGDRPAADLVAPLVEQTWQNLRRATPEGALTGPVARGDAETIQKHLEELAEDRPHLIPFYAALSTEMVRVAVRAGHLNQKRAETLLGLLQDKLPSSSEPDGSSNSSN